MDGWKDQPIPFHGLAHSKCVYFFWTLTEMTKIACQVEDKTLGSINKTTLRAVEKFMKNEIIFIVHISSKNYHTIIFWQFKS